MQLLCSLNVKNYTKSNLHLLQVECFFCVSNRTGLILIRTYTSMFRDNDKCLPHPKYESVVWSNNLEMVNQDSQILLLNAVLLPFSLKTKISMLQVTRSSQWHNIDICKCYFYSITLPQINICHPVQQPHMTVCISVKCMCLDN